MALEESRLELRVRQHILNEPHYLHSKLICPSKHLALEESRLELRIRKHTIIVASSCKVKTKGKYII
jgi:hypothetical protein